MDKIFSRKNLNIGCCIFLIFISIGIGLIVHKNIHQLNKNQLESEKVKLIDKTKNIYIFRGNTPTKFNTFDYNKLKYILKNKANKHGYYISDNFYLIDISLLRPYRPFYEALQLKAEKKFFDENSDKGRLISAPLNFVTNSEIEHYKINELFYAARSIYKAIYNRDKNRDLVIYVHCEHGINRTGSVIALYNMLYKNMPKYESIRLSDSFLPMRQRAKNTFKFIEIPE